MKLFYNIGNMDILRDFRFLLLMFLFILMIGFILRVKKALNNYNYLISDISVLDNINELSSEEFVKWAKQLALNNGNEIIRKISHDIYLAKSKVGLNIVYITRTYQILDKIDMQKLYGAAVINGANDILVITTAMIDKSFYEYAQEKKVKIDKFDKSDFKIGYNDFVLNQNYDI
ncbi:MAG: hypothetical protein ACRC57_11360 [Sarcina sp.]